MRLTKKNRAIAQEVRSNFLERAAEIQKLDQGPHDHDPRPNSVSLDSFEFKHRDETAWRSGNATFKDGAVVELKVEDKRVVFEGEVNDLYGVRTLEISQGNEATLFVESYQEPMYKDHTSISSSNSDGKILSFDRVVDK